MSARNDKAAFDLSMAEHISDINIAVMDASVLRSSILDRLENFEYRDRDKESIDALYTFVRLIGGSIETINSLNKKMEDATFSNRGAA